jgi:hypothetical protein
VTVSDDGPIPEPTPPLRPFPLPRLLAAIRLAFDPRKLTIAAVGVILLQAGWSGLEVALPSAIATTPDPLELAPLAGWQAEGVPWSWEGLAALSFRLAAPARSLIVPLRVLLDPASGWATMLHALLALTWLFVVWGLGGGAISRIAAIQLARARQARLGEGLGFAVRSAWPLIVAPLSPLLALAFCALLGAAFGLLYALPRIGPGLAGALLWLPMAGGLVMTFLVAGLVAGWPLLHAAIATGADDALDAISRTFAYLNQRLGLFLTGLAAAWLAGVVGLFVIDLLAGGVIRLTEWSLSLSARGSVISTLFGRGDLDTGTVAAATHRFWLGAVRLLAQGWAFSYFWTAAAVLYLGLRHEVDGKAWNEIDPECAAAATVAAPPMPTTPAVVSGDSAPVTSPAAEIDASTPTPTHHADPAPEAPPAPR